ncbi:nitrate reductase [Lewinella sp. JB7]|uniref:nitrate reductase n=1 Tax=Lewinella sp. JB7 TaxID=2962887 RepID=UPI0020CA0C7F|nr:nitrate reductase [Lewinella sp. JB7]MCP9236573.1 molybdopterin-dependent oxidoreductase [Lewinella sp. JB7]
MTATEVKTTCSYCGVGCGIIARQDVRGRLSVEGDPDHPANLGQLCSKGRTLNYVVQDQSDRLLYPQLRYHRAHPLQRVSWERAMDRAAAVFRSVIAEHGPDSVAFYVSGQCLTEEYYLINKLTKGYFGTNNIDTNSRLCMSSAVVAYTKMLGEDAVPVSYADIDHADCLLVAGANPAWCHPILWRRVEARKAAHPHLKIIVVDPRRTDTCALADLHLQIVPGTDVLLYHAIARRLYDTDRMDMEFIRQHTEAGENYVRILKSLHLRSAAKTCGVSLEDIKLAADYIGDARAFLSMWAMGLNQSRVGVEKNGALINLHLLTGQIGKPGAGPFSLTGQPNAMGGREVGGMASLLAAHRVLSNPDHREEVARFWGVPSLPARPGYTATELVSALHAGKVKAVWIVCTNPSVSLPNALHADGALRKARFVVVQDISHRSDTTAYADLLLPAAGWLEKTGTMTNSDRRVSLLQPLVPPPGEARPDADIIIDFARRMGFAGFDYRDVSEVYDEYARLTAGTRIDVSGLSHDRLRREGTFQWPVPSPDHPGTPRLFTDHRFYTPTGRARFMSTVSHADRPPAAPADRPLILTTGRIRDQWHTMTRTGKVARLRRHVALPYLDIHPLDAAGEKLENDQLAVVHSARGEVRVKIRYSRDLRRGVVFLPMHWGKTLGSDLTRANNLTDDAVDPYSKQPNFKFCHVGVRAYVKPTEHLLVIGAGAAAFRFVSHYRELNTRDRITVFSRETHAFYNRILLPEYVTDHLSWEQLEKLREQERLRLDFALHPETSVERIDRANRTVYTATGEAHTYDRLIIATGSRPFVPRDVPLYLPGVFTMRRREDADGLSDYLRLGQQAREAHVLIVGGGLLGLELAAALQEIGVRITLVQRSNRLMERQLDATASQILAEDVGERGIQTYFRNEVDTIFPLPAESGAGAGAMRVTFKSGISLVCNAVVYAIGTRPNLEVGRTAGLKCGGGIQVDDRLTTSDPYVHAIGEVAEWRGKRFGITAAAEQQAQVLAAYLAGDLTAAYAGSVPMNILKFRDLDLCSLGEVSPPPDDPDYEEVIFRDLSRRYYKKCVVHRDRLVGAVLIGDKNEFAEYRALIEDRLELGERREELLRSGSAREPLRGRVVCSCNNVGEGNLADAIAGGCRDFNELVARSGAGLGCGSCKPEVRNILDHQLQTP